MIRKIPFCLTALIPAFLMPSDAFASKTYLPILEVGKKWTYINYAVSGELNKPAVPWTWEAIDMTEEDGHQVFTLLYEDTESDDSSTGYEFTKNEYEADGVLWYLSEEYGGYVPMIDFNMEVGDTIDGYEEVIWKGPVVIEGVERCVIVLQIPGREDVYYWIEGIGSVDDVSITPMPMVTGERTRMTECWMGGTCLFDINRMDEYMDPYVSEIRQMVGTAEDAPLYDILGRRITIPAPGQLYIQGGKKHIAK